MTKLKSIGFLLIVCLCLMHNTYGDDVHRKNNEKILDRSKRSIWTRLFGSDDDTNVEEEHIEVTTLPIIVSPSPVHHYPVWKVHKYKGMDLRPMPISMLANQQQLIHVGGHLPPHIQKTQQLPQQFSLPIKNFQPFISEQKQIKHTETKIIEPADELQRLANLIGIKDVATLPTLDQVMSLVGTNSHDETVEMVRDIASTPEGVQLIKSFLQNQEQQNAEDFYLSEPESYDFNANDHQHLDTAVKVEQHEITEDEHHPKYHSDAYSLQEPRTPTLEGYKVLPSPGLLALTGVPSTLDRTHTNLGIIQTIIPTPQPGEGLFSRLANFANFFRFSEEPEIPIRPVSPLPIPASPLSYQYYVKSPQSDISSHHDNEPKEEHELDNEEEEIVEDSVEEEAEEEIVEANHDDNDTEDESHGDGEIEEENHEIIIPHEGVQIPQLPSLPQLPHFQGFATIPKIPQIPQLHIPKQFKMPDHIASAHQYPGTYIRVKYPLNGFNPLPHNYQAISTSSDHLPNNYQKYQPQPKYQYPVIPLVSNQYELPANTAGWTPSFYNSNTDSYLIKNVQKVTSENHPDTEENNKEYEGAYIETNVQNTGIESLPLDNYDVFKNAPQILTSYGTPALPYTYPINDRDTTIAKQTIFHDFNTAASKKQETIIEPPLSIIVTTTSATSTTTTSSPPPPPPQTTEFVKQTGDGIEKKIDEIKRRSDTNQSYPQRISPFDAVATGKIHIADPDAIQLFGKSLQDASGDANEAANDNLMADRVATLTSIDLNDRIGRKILYDNRKIRNIDETIKLF